MKTRIITFNIDEFSEINSAINSYHQNDDFEVVVLDKVEQLTKALEESDASILIFSIQTKEKFQGLVAAFKNNLKSIKTGRIKLAYVQISKNPKIETLLQKFFCNDFLDSKILSKSLNYKIDIWSKNVIVNAKKFLASSNIVKENKKKVLQDKTRRSSHIVNNQAPLEEGFDIWLSPKNNCKAILSKWLVSLYGPSPHVSTWESEKPGVWKYILESDQAKIFLKKEGTWFFEGQKPEFSWKEKSWSFSSNNFHLYFVDIDGNHYSKIKSNLSDLDIKSNSSYANSLLSRIVETVNDKINLKTSKDKVLQEDKRELKGSQEKKEYLEADSKTDKINSHMAGESKGEEDKGGNYSGILKKNTINEASELDFKDKQVDGEHLSGKGSMSDSLSNLSGNIDTSKKSNNFEDLNQANIDRKQKEKEQNSSTQKDDESNNNAFHKKQINKEVASKDLDRRKEEDESEEKSDMLASMVNPSKNAVRVTHGSMTYLCDLVDLFEEELYVTLTESKLEKDLKYSVVVTMDMGKSKVSITTEGVVDSVEDQIYKLLISKVPNSEFEKFMTCFEERQDEINDFIQQARGF